METLCTILILLFLIPAVIVMNVIAFDLIHQFIRNGGKLW